MISTMSRGGHWLLVNASTGPSSNYMAGASGSKAETIHQYWAGDKWSANVHEAMAFPTQIAALRYRDEHKDDLAVS